MSLRARLLAGIAFVAVVLVAVSAVITVTTRDRLIDQVDRRLESFAPDRARGPQSPRGMPDERHLLDEMQNPRRPDPADDGDGRLSDAFVGLLGGDGQLSTRFAPNTGDGAFSPPAVDPAALPAQGRRVLTVDSADGSTTYRVLTQRLDTVTLITALPIDDVQATTADLLWIEVLGSLAILVALGLVGWWVIHLGIRPVQQMTEAAGHIADGDLDVRLPEAATGTESAALAVALNRMLGQIQQAFHDRAEAEARLRRFVADASHELRTPITTIRGYAELYRHGGLADRADLDDAMRRTEQEATRMGRLVEDMLTLAKFDEARPLQVRPTDLVAVVADVVADARVIEPGRTVQFRAGSPTAVVDGDEDRLRQVVGNVVTNALVHTAADVPIRVRVEDLGDRVAVEVEDRGEGMDPETAERVTERFFRADPARARHRGGSGLGLSIVADTVAAHGGSLEIISAVGHGTTVRLLLPRRPPAAPVSDGA